MALIGRHNMPLPIVPIITGLISAFGEKKVPGFSQSVKEFTTSKTNLTGGGLFGYGLSLLLTDPSNKIGHFYLIIGALAPMIKDAIVKIKSSAPTD